MKKELFIPEDYFLVPIPMTKRKILLRGFNQTEILAKNLAPEKTMPVLQKIKETKEQAKLNFQERKTNLKNAFIVQERPPKNIILIDDVITSGNTLKECAQVLKNSSTKKIIALTILYKQ